MMKKIIGGILCFVLMLFLVDRGVSWFLLKGLERYYGINQKADILMIGHSHMLKSCNEEDIEAGLNAEVSKFCLEGVLPPVRHIMAQMFMEGRVQGSVPYVLYSVDPYMFRKSDDIALNTYKVFYPYMDSPYVDALVRKEASSHFDYYLHKWVRTARFTDNMVYRSLRGWLDMRRSFENWVMSEQQWNEMKPVPPRIDHEVMACFRQTLDFLVSRGCRVVLVEAPIAYRNLCPREIEEVSAIFQSIAEASPHIDYFNYGPSFCAQRELFCDPVHVNHRGEKLVTEALIQDLKQIQQKN